MRLLTALFVLLAFPLAAADVSGTWQGTLRIVMPDGKVVEQPVIFTLQQSGNTVTGSAGSAERQQEIENGEIGADGAMRFQAGNRFLILKVSSDTMHGGPGMPRTRREPEHSSCSLATGNHSNTLILAAG